MRIVVFSDSHGHSSPLRDIMAARGDADLFLHLGDGAREFDALRASYPQRRMLYVRGNCDWGEDAKFDDLLTVGATRIFFTHGHVYDVKSGLDSLLRRAGELAANIACFGHTHMAYSGYRDGVYLLNPGSVWAPRRKGPSYGLIDLTDAGIAVNLVYFQEAPWS